MNAEVRVKMLVMVEMRTEEHSMRSRIVSGICSVSNLNVPLSLIQRLLIFTFRSFILFLFYLVVVKIVWCVWKFKGVILIRTHVRVRQTILFYSCLWCV